MSLNTGERSVECQVAARKQPTRFCCQARDANQSKGWIFGRRACEQYLRSGHVDEGMTLCRSLLREVGLGYPEKHWAVLASLLWSRLRLRLAMLRTRRKAIPTPNAEQELKLDICWTVTVGMSMIDVLRSTDFQARYTLLRTAYR